MKFFSTERKAKTPKKKKKMNANQKIFERNKSETVFGGALVRKIIFWGELSGPKSFVFLGGLGPQKPVSGRQFAPRKVLYVTIYIAIYDGIIPIYVQESEK